MKEKYPAEVSCPKCGNLIKFDMWTHVDSELNIEETFELTSGSFFRHICPECGATVNIYHSLGSIDPRSKTIINYIQSDEDEEKRAEYARDFQEFFSKDGGDIRSKLVFTPDEFIDCVRRVRFEYVVPAEAAKRAAF